MNQKKISVGFVCYEFPFGGVEKNIIDIGNFLSDNGMDVYVLCETFDKKAYPLTKKQNYQIIEIGTDSFRTSETMAHAIIESVRSSDLQLDVMICHVYNESFKLIKHELGCKFIYTLQCMPFADVRSWIEKKKAKDGVVNKLKYIATKLFIKNLLYFKYKKKFINKYREIYEFSDIYTCLCDSYKTELTKVMGLTYDDPKIQVIYNFEEVSETLSNNKRDKTILYVGRLFNSDKKVDRLLRIWEDVQSQLPEWKLVIAGDGPDRESLEKLSSDLGLNRITFLGWINCSGELMEKASILCLTSEAEGWPLALMEAQAKGLPIISFDCSAGVHEILSPNGINGILVPHRNEKLYTKALVELANDSKKREFIAQNAFNHVKQFSIEETGTKWLEIINSLTERNPVLKF